MKTDEIAKNLLLEQTCDNCFWFMGDECCFEWDPLNKNKKKVPEFNTCDNWKIDHNIFTGEPFVIQSDDGERTIVFDGNSIRSYEPE